MKDIHERYRRILAEGATPGALFLLLSELKQAGDPEGVIRGCTEALGLFPTDARLRHLMAETCLETGRLSLAESEVERATAEIDRLIPAYRLKAEIYLRVGRPQDARRALEIYLAHRPGDAEALALLEKSASLPTPPASARLPEFAGEPEAVPEFRERGQEFIEEASVPEIATPTLAEVYLGQGQIQEAIATYQKFLAQNPEAERSRKRLEELQAMVFAPALKETETAPDPVRVKKERMVAVLEAWRSRLREEAAAPR
jgi:tetratricopeptide (TPR) repeat protein